MEHTVVDPAREQAKASYTGLRLTDSQFEEAWNITAILHRENLKTGSFTEKLTDFSHAFARSQKFDAVKGEMIVRDLYTARYGQSLNQTREGLLQREEAVQATGRDRALAEARSMEGLIKEGPTMPLYRAYDQVAVRMARDLGITETGAKRMMKETFEQAEGRDLYSWGKDLETRFHRPVADAERTARRTQKQEMSRGYARTGPSR